MNALCVQGFQHFGLVVHVDGTIEDSWTHCCPACGYCSYSPAAIQYIIQSNQNISRDDHEKFFGSCNPSYHWICKIACEYHSKPGKILSLKLGTGSKFQAGKISQHFLNKCNKNREEMETALFAFRCVCI